MLPIKVVHIIPSLNKGGAERFVIDLCNEFSKTNDYSVFLISLKENNSHSSFLKDLSPLVTYYSLNKGAGLNIKTILDLTKLLRQIRPHVIHTHIGAFEYISLFNLLYNHSGKVKVFHTIHNSAEKESALWVMKTIKKYFFQRNVIPISISESGHQSYMDYYGLSNDVIIINGSPQRDNTIYKRELAIKYKNPIKDGFLFVHIGRIMKQKNQLMLVESFKIFNKEKRHKLIIVGDVRDEEIYKDISRSLEGRDDIVLEGGQSNVIDYLSISDAFCLSSLYEGMPISLIEAMSVGCIPICTPVGGIPEMITGNETGFLANDITEESFVKSLKEFEMSSKKDIIRLNCINEFEHKYHISITVKKHLDLYNN